MSIKSYKLITIGMMVFMFASLLFQIAYTNSVALKGDEFSSLNSKKSALEKEITLLSFEDSKLTSINYISEKAKSLGFISNNSALLSISALPNSVVAVVTNY
jgi:cell division protein FtsL